MTTVEIKEKQTPEMPKIEESDVPSEKENIKFMDDENEEIKNELKKETEVIGDGLKKDKIFNNVSKFMSKMDIYTDCFSKSILIYCLREDAKKCKVGLFQVLFH
jgi:cobalamin biosynthesis protein CobT